MLNYILQVVFAQALFLGFYYFFLKGETYFNTNRFYLLGTLLLSFVLPGIKLSSFAAVSEPIATELTRLPEVLINTSNPLNQAEVNYEFAFGGTQLIYFTVVLSVLAVFIYRIARLLQLIKTQQFTRANQAILIELKDSVDAFSFFNYVFLGDKLEEKAKKHILKHELIHVKHFHSLDIIALELLTIFFWFNPMLLLYKSQLREVHEYIADNQSSKADKTYYVNSLLAQLFSVQEHLIANHFFNSSIIKKRILMLNKVKSKSINKLKYAVTLPIIVFMLFIASCDSNEATPLDDNLVSNAEIQITEIKGQTETEMVAFSNIDNVPVFPGCESSNDTEKRDCFSKKISEFVMLNFNADLASELELEGVQRIISFFIIDKNGNVTDIKARAAHPKLQEEAIRVVKLLPKMAPGIHHNNPVDVAYALPIAYKIAP